MDIDKGRMLPVSFFSWDKFLFVFFLFVALDIPDIMSRVLLPEIAAIPPFANFLSSI